MSLGTVPSFTPHFLTCSRTWLYYKLKGLDGIVTLINAGRPDLTVYWMGYCRGNRSCQWIQEYKGNISQSRSKLRQSIYCPYFMGSKAPDDWFKPLNFGLMKLIMNRVRLFEFSIPLLMNFLTRSMQNEIFIPQTYAKRLMRLILGCTIFIITGSIR